MVGDRNFGVFVLKERIPLLELPMHYQVWLAKNGIHNDGDVAQYEFAKVAQSRELKSALLCCLSLLRKGKTSEWLAERLLSLERGRRKLCEQKKMTEAEEGEWKRAQVQRMRRTASDSRKHDTTATKAMPMSAITTMTGTASSLAGFRPDGSVTHSTHFTFRM